MCNYGLYVGAITVLRLTVLMVPSFEHITTCSCEGFDALNYFTDD